MVSPTWAVILDGLKAITPVPPTIIVWSVLEGTEVAVGVAADVDEAEAAVPLVAAAWKAANSLPGLMAKTMPDWQWFAWRQYAQIGVVFWTVSSAVGKLLVRVSATGMNPESKPPARGAHGLSKVDWVTVWFFCWKVNRTTSPTLALTDDGLNFRTPGPPTVTSKVAARAMWADAKMKSEPRAKWRIATIKTMGG